MKEKHTDWNEGFIEILGLTTLDIALATINLNPTVFLSMVVLMVEAERSRGCTYPLEHTYFFILKTFTKVAPCQIFIV